MTPEFDRYALGYSDLLRNPIRDRFANDSGFFYLRKWMLIHDFFEARHISLASLNWLDVGCGQGELLELAGSRFARAVGCDPSAKMMAACTRTRVIEQPSPTELPFPSESFDFVTAVCVYHHVPIIERARLTASIHRVLKRGGFFCLIEHNPWNPITQLIVRSCPVDLEAQLMRKSAALQVMRSAALDVIDTSYFLYLPEAAFDRLGRIERYLRKLPAGGQFAVFGRKRLANTLAESIELVS